MKTVEQWFAEYAVSHQNELNTKIHFVCVPIIYFSIIGMFLSINTSILTNFISIDLPLLVNWAVVIFIPVMLFYLRLSFKVFLKMFGFSLICLIGNFYLAKIVPLLFFSILIFVVAWIGQFYGHKVEGKKPSFFKDLQFLLIGPIWVFEKMLGRKA